ncbi:MAG: hypothetical protein JXQ73_09270 [Phycisphaerae bacterium]|nr:hypothetical protein [Phycisphaerae bacterium]
MTGRDGRHKSLKGVARGRKPSSSECERGIVSEGGVWHGHLGHEGFLLLLGCSMVIATGKMPVLRGLVTGKMAVLRGRGRN